MTGERLRKQLTAEEPMIAPGVYDAFTARIVESLGFDSLYLGGGYTAGLSLGIKEPLLTMTDMRERASEITRRSDLPLIVDGNAGFGTPSHTYRTVEEFAKAGISAVHIEDQVYPKGIGYHSGELAVTSVAEMVEKIHAAVRAVEAAEQDILLIARSDVTHASTGKVEVAGTRKETTIEDAIERVNEFFDAGADVGMVFPADVAELEYAVEHSDGPLLVPYAESHEPRLSVSEFEELGVAGVFYPYTPTLATLKAVRSAYTQLADEGKTGLDEDESNSLIEAAESLLGYPD